MKRFLSVTLCILCLTLSMICVAEETVENEMDESIEKIKLFLLSAYQYKGEHPHELRIQMALNAATTKREQPGNSTDILLRNSEYYLHGLYATASGDIEHTTATVGVTMYVALKYAAYAAKNMGVDWFEKMLRSDPDNPMSPPGGIFWAYSGLCDGLRVDGTKIVSETSAIPISLFSCGIDTDLAPPKPPPWVDAQ